MPTERIGWLPAVVLGAGVLMTLGIRDPNARELRSPLATLPSEIGQFEFEDRALDAGELATNGATAYLLRFFERPLDGRRFSVYVGYYAHQRNGKTTHSPKNCLPGSGWEALSADTRSVEVSGGVVPVNRYLLSQRGDRAVVYYWYQGRGRVAASEYRVKWELLRDAALKARSEEAMVRIVVPLRNAGDDAAADRLAEDVIREMVPALYTVLPT